MDNASRSERTRKVALEAALVVIARDGPGRLTLDAIAREAGISKGGLMHQFPNKQAVLKALLERQIAHFEDFTRQGLEKLEGKTANPNLIAQISTFREVAQQPRSIAIAFLAALAEEPALLSMSRASDAARVAAVKAEAGDPDLALLRRAAAEGIALSGVFGLSSLSDAERGRLFARLLDDERWGAPAALDSPEAKRPSRPANKAANKAAK
jgi:AcrR family transcriptional regulator